MNLNELTINFYAFVCATRECTRHLFPTERNSPLGYISSPLNTLVVVSSQNLSCPCWPWIQDLPASASTAAKIAGLCQEVWLKPHSIPSLFLAFYFLFSEDGQNELQGRHLYRRNLLQKSNLCFLKGKKTCRVTGFPSLWPLSCSIC